MAPANQPPAAAGAVPSQTVPAGQSVMVDAARYFNDPDGDALRYLVATSNSGVATASVAASTVTVTGVGRGDAGVTITATDPGGLSAQQRMAVTVPNQPPFPTREIPAQTVPSGESRTLDVSAHFIDPDGDPLTFSATSTDSTVATASAAADVVTVVAVARGTAHVIVTAADAEGRSPQLTFPITVPNRPPLAVNAPPGHEVALGDTASIGLGAYFTDPDGDSLVYQASSSNRGTVAAFVVAGTLRVAALGKGLVTVTVTARDTGGLTAQQRFLVTVPNRAPVVVDSIADLDLAVGERAIVDLANHFADPDGDALIYAVAMSDPLVVGAAVRGDTLELAAYAQGIVGVVVAATDTDRAAITLAFELTVPNRAPLALGRLPDVRLSQGESVSVRLAFHFADPDGDSLSFTATATDSAVARVSVAGGSLTMTGRVPGAVTVTVFAADPGGLTAALTFGVTVRTSAHGYRIEVTFTGPVSTTAESQIHEAARRWERILAATNLPEVRIPAGRSVCRGAAKLDEARVVKGIWLLVAVTDIDGPNGTIAGTGVCSVRRGSLLPVTSDIILDAADVARHEGTWRFAKVALHEIAHALGFGALWRHHNLLRDSSIDAGERLDTHFLGRLATVAFDAAGGHGYSGKKVPVENSTGAPGVDDGHWRQSVFHNELMGPFISSRPQPLSAITIQSMADLGYHVDTSLAEPYELPSATARAAAELERTVELRDDIVETPIAVLDADGRVVRVIRR